MNHYKDPVIQQPWKVRGFFSWLKWSKLISSSLDLIASIKLVYICSTLIQWKVSGRFVFLSGSIDQTEARRQNTFYVHSVSLVDSYLTSSKNATAVCQCLENTP